MCTITLLALGFWACYFELIYDEGLTEQPDGQVGLYISDFLGPTGLPPAFCRPPAGASLQGRDPQIILTYTQLRNIFLRARDIHQGTSYQKGNYGEEKNLPALTVKLENRTVELEQARERADIATYQLGMVEEKWRRGRERADVAARQIAMLEETRRQLDKNE